MFGRLSLFFLFAIVLCASCTRFRRVSGSVYGTEQSYFVSQRIKCFRYALEANIAVLKITELGATSYECQLFTEVTHVMQESELHMRTFVVDLRPRGDTCPAAYETIAEHLAIKWIYKVYKSGGVQGTSRSHFVAQRMRHALKEQVAVLQITEHGATSYECRLFAEVTHVIQESELHSRTFVVDLRPRGDTCPTAYETIAEHLAIKWVYEPSEAIEKLEQVAVFQITEHGATSYECRLFTEFTHVMQESELHTRTFVVDLRPRTDTCPAAYETIAEHLAVAWVYKPNEAIRKSLIALKKIEKTEVRNRNRARRLCFVALTTRRLEL